MNDLQRDRLLTSLPPHLAERIRLLGDRPMATHGEFVLYWMHHAVRGHENPALDAAIWLANALRLPVLVYQGLGGRHRFNSDRHHTFVLEGARDAHRELKAKGLRAVLHLAERLDRPSPLGGLADRAAAVVVEDYPAPPFPAWTERLAQRSPAPVVAVDCCCLVPMQAQPKRFSRAFDFRRSNQRELERRLPLPWPEITPAAPAWSDGGLGFDPLDLEQADITEVCARCAIDHGVPAVPHTPGGSRAGYARWEAFRDQGLRAYARERNDAAIEWPRGVSRLSPYLHHGQVSPFRIAREAHAVGGDGAEKFLDELLVWRELAFNFCFHTKDPERIEALPDWAQATLREHASDPRPVILDPESLARSRTGDALWDLAQTSLRIHGELHNNVRMTWAKAIIPWRPDPQAALDSLIELNHRYALDGSDPNSYGGLLWSLGLFDRPFPDAPVTGTLRGRSTTTHARRLDLPRYAQRVSRPATGRAQVVAVIGAGIAGLSAARTLQDQGHRVTVFEKARGTGGRASTRRIGELAFDHGAQYFTARDPVFRRAVAAWQERGVVSVWHGRLGTVSDGRITPMSDGRERFVAVPGMSALARHLASDLAVRTGVRAAPPERRDGRWHLRSDAGETLGAFDLLIVAAPAPQARDLLGPSAPKLADRAAAVTYAPVWALMLSFASDPPLPYDGLFFDRCPIAWAARNSSKPGRRGNTWVIHASPDWTRARLDVPAEAIAAELTSALATHAGIDPTAVTGQTAHRWLYSLAENPLDTGALWEPDLGLAVCGDWCLGARIEAAYLSGQAAAGRVLGHLASDTRAAEARQPAHTANAKSVGG